MMVALLLVSMTSDYSNSCSKVKVVEASQVPILSKLMMMLTTIATMTIQPTKRIVAAENERDQSLLQLYLYLAISSYIQVYLAISSYIQLYLAISSYIQGYLGISRYIQLYLGISSYIQLYLAISRRCAVSSKA